MQYIEGGATRAESVYKGFCALNPADEDFVLIHDAARPCLGKHLIERMTQALKEHPAVIPVVPLADTVKEVCENKVIQTLDRRKLFGVQTPQGFSCALLKRVYKSGSLLGEQYTDEAMMVESLGEAVFTVPGEKTNIKVTTAEDLKIAECFISEARCMKQET